MSFEPIRRILPKAISEAGITRQVNAARILEEAQAVVQAYWGEEKAAFVEVVSFQEGVLKLQATAPTALQELKLWEIRIQNELNRRLGSKIVHRMKIQSASF